MTRNAVRGIRTKLGRVLSRASSLVTPAARPSAEPESKFSAAIEGWWSRSQKLRGNASAEVVQFTPERTAPIAVVLHVHFPELLDELLERLVVMPVAFDLLVTNSSGAPVAVDVTGLPVRRLVIRDVSNHGRDILPLIGLVNDGLLDDYELILKMHTKRSAWRADHDGLAGDGDAWRADLLDGLVRDREQIEATLSSFAEDPTLGMLTAPGSVVGAEFWGGDEHIVRDLLRRIQMDVEYDDLRFAAGSMYWTRAFLLQGLRSLDLVADDFEEEAGQVDATTAHGVERALGFLAAAAGYDIRDGIAEVESVGWQRWATDAPRTARARVVPFYLPQFHTFPENDEWWGRGFTEWSNTTAARPLFNGHVQPLLPSELGFYDLANSGIRDRQYALAKAHGLEGFMYYYYWFSGESLMSRPLEDLHSSDASHPFCIMWANENWTRTWDGMNTGVLKGQDYDSVPADRFINDVLHLLTDPRYIRVDERPLIAVYKIAQLPDPVSTFRAWRAAALNAGLPGLHIVSVDVGRDMDGFVGAPQDLGFDAYLEFPPHNFRWDAQSHVGLNVDTRFTGNLMSYPEFVEGAVTRLLGSDRDHHYPGVMVTFDNTARRQWRPDVWYGSNPYVFRRWLNAATDSIMHRDRDERIIFVNAWNEWAEGAVLEPTQRFGRGYLHAVRDVLYR